MRFSDKVAVVTGAGSGMGLAMAIAFAREGARVVVIDIDEKSGAAAAGRIQDQGGRALFMAADITRKSSVEGFVRQAVEAFGRIDILVNNAGLVRGAPFVSISEEAWETTLAVNLKGAFFCAQAVAPGMMERSYGKILNISSRAFLGSVGQMDYVASKGGMVSLTRAPGP